MSDAKSLRAKVHIWPAPLELGLVPRATFADQILRKIYEVPPIRYLFFLGAVIPYQLVRVIVYEGIIKGVLINKVLGGILRTVGLLRKPDAKALTPAQQALTAPWTPERSLAAGKKLLGPYAPGESGGPGVVDGLYHSKLPGSEDGVEIHVVESVARRADPDAALVLFVHGFPEDWYTWVKVLKSKLGEKFHLLAVDLRGYGGSTKPEGRSPYTVFKITDDLKAVVTSVLANKTNKRVKVVGHDWGGALSWAFTQRFNEIVDQLVIINCPPASVLGTNMTWRQLGKSWYIFIFQLPKLANNMLLAQDAMPIGGMFPDNLDTADVHRFNALQPNAMESMINYYRVNATAPQVSGKVKVRTLVIWVSLSPKRLNALLPSSDLLSFVFQKPGPQRHCPRRHYVPRRPC